MHKTLFIFLLTLFCFGNLKAEYGGLYIKYSIETFDGKTYMGYGAYSEYDDFDTILEDPVRLLNLIAGSDDSIRLYSHMLRYDYNWWYNEEKMTQRALYDPFKVALSDVSSIVVLKTFDFSYMTSMGTSHQLSDTLWMKKPPADTASASGYLCSWLIFVHEHNAEVEAILKRLEEMKKPLKELDKEYRSVKKAHGFGYELDKINERIDSIRNDALDKNLSKIIGELNQYKVVVIQECSC